MVAVVRNARVDRNQREIVAALRKAGASVQHLHGVGKQRALVAEAELARERGGREAAQHYKAMWETTRKHLALAEAELERLRWVGVRISLEKIEARGVVRHIVGYCEDESVRKEVFATLKKWSSAHVQDDEAS